MYVICAYSCKQTHGLVHWWNVFCFFFRFLAVGPCEVAACTSKRPAVAFCTNCATKYQLKEQDYDLQSKISLSPTPSQNIDQLWSTHWVFIGIICRKKCSALFLPTCEDKKNIWRTRPCLGPPQGRRLRIARTAQRIPLLLKPSGNMNPIQNLFFRSHFMEKTIETIDIRPLYIIINHCVANLWMCPFKI